MQNALAHEDVERGVHHLHALGLVHGDVNPSDIMEDKSCNRAVLADFDSCRPVGERLGPQGWDDGLGFSRFSRIC